MKKVGSVSFLPEVDACSAGFFDTGDGGNDPQSVKDAAGRLCCFNRKLVSDRKPERNPAGGTADRKFACVGFLPVCAVAEHTDAGNPFGAGEAALPGTVDGIDAVDLPLYFILADTTSAIRTSQNCRLGYQDYRTSLRSFGELCAVLFVRALKRSNDLYTAMDARGYDGKIRILHEKRPVKRKELAAVIVFELILTGVALWIR